MIIEQAVCPKCNADASIKLNERLNTKYYVAYLDCSKCKAHIYKGIYTLDQVKKLKARNKVKRLIERIDSKILKEKLVRLLESLENDTKSS